MHAPAIASISKTCYSKDVYEPAEDSFLLVDCLVQDLSLLSSFPAARFVEVGSGSGYVITSLALLLKGAASAAGHGWAVDITSEATVATAETLRQHGVVHVLLFNPPYVPTPDEEVQRGGIAAAWAGGDRGRRVTDRLLPQVPCLLAPGGLFYVVTVPENDPEDIATKLAMHGLQATKLMTRSADEELLTVYRYKKMPP